MLGQEMKFIKLNNIITPLFSMSVSSQPWSLRLKDWYLNKNMIDQLFALLQQHYGVNAN